MVIYVTFHPDRTSASLKTTLIKKINLSWTKLNIYIPSNYPVIICSGRFILFFEPTIHVKRKYNINLYVTEEIVVLSFLFLS